MTPDASPAFGSAERCPRCGTELAPFLLACPACHRLRHGTELERLARSAEEAERAGDATAALAAWRSALELLPSDAGQAQKIAAHVATLSRGVDGKALTAGATAGPKQGTVWAKVLAPLGAVGLLLWKFKFLAALALGKAKFVLLGLTKLGTLSTLLVSIGAYWALWGWRLALGLLISIYIHEMGHVYVLRKLGFRSDAPLFIPGVGAFVLLKQRPVDAREDARIGLAGPWWGLGTAAACYGIYAAGGSPYWAAVVRLGAWINLFNLLPVWQLDGGRAFRALGRGGRWLAAAVLAVAWVASHEGLLILLVIAAAARAFSADQVASDRKTLVHYALLTVLLTALTMLAPTPQL